MEKKKNKEERTIRKEENRKCADENSRQSNDGI